MFVLTKQTDAKCKLVVITPQIQFPRSFVIPGFWVQNCPILFFNSLSQVMRVIIFDQLGNVLNKFGCSKHLEFPNGVVVNDRQEIFISDNRAHCVKVFDYEGNFLRQIGGEGMEKILRTTMIRTGDIRFEFKA